jgi:phage FluMu protein Com
MLFAKDDDEFPIRCRFCHYEFYEKVGRLKAGLDINCPACKTLQGYTATEFAKVLELARKNPDDFFRQFTRLSAFRTRPNSPQP